MNTHHSYRYHLFGTFSPVTLNADEEFIGYRGRIRWWRRGRKSSWMGRKYIRERTHENKVRCSCRKTRAELTTVTTRWAPSSSRRWAPQANLRRSGSKTRGTFDGKSLCHGSLVSNFSGVMPVENIVSISSCLFYQHHHTLHTCHTFILM